MTMINLFEGVAGGLLLWIGAPHLLKLLQISRLRRHCRSSRIIVLTYDDGPGTVLTPALLKLLASNNVHANFFMIGKKVEFSPLQVSDVMGNGHAIGSHSFMHLHAWKCNPVKAIRDIRAGFQVGKHNSFSNWFRPPFGKITLATLIYIWISRHKLAWWTIDSTDTWSKPLSVEAIIDRVRKEDGGVILMHDNDRSDINRHEYVIKLTQRLIEFARDEGYVIRTLQDLTFQS